MAVAANEAVKTRPEEMRRLRDVFEQRLFEMSQQVVVHSKGAPRLPNTSCFSIPGMHGRDVADALAVRGVLVGIGSACSDGALSPPKTLLAMGVEHSIASGAIRVSIGCQTTENDVLAAVDVLREILCGNASPLLA
jgi:cysteine desulfurase